MGQAKLQLKTDSSGLNLKLSGPQHAVAGIYGWGKFVLPNFEEEICVMRIKAPPREPTFFEPRYIR